MSTIKDLQKAREMAQSLKYFLHKHGGLHLPPQPPTKTMGMVACTCDHSAGQPDTGGSLALLTGHPVLHNEPQVTVRDLVSPDMAGCTCVLLPQN